MDKIIIPCDINYPDKPVFESCGANIIDYIYGNTGILIDRGINNNVNNSYKNTAEYGSRLSLEKVIFDENITRIGNNAFNPQDSNNTIGKIHTVIWPQALKTIGQNAFINQQSLKEVILPDNVTSIEQQAFKNNRIETLILPQSLIEIKANAFRDNIVLKGKVTLHKNTQLVEESPFNNAQSLEELEIVNSDIVLHFQAFAYTSSMNKVTLPCDMTYYYNQIFEGCKNKEIYYTKGKTGMVKDRSYNKNEEHARFYTIEFETVNTLKKVVFEDGITHIGNALFWPYYSDSEYGHIETIIWPKTLKTIGNDAFRSQGDLKDIHLPEGVESIGNLAFYDNYNVETLTLPYSLKTIGEYAFANCSALTSKLVISDNIETIYKNAFADTKAIT